MRKIRLQLESLAVESFDTTGPRPDAGTVAAHQIVTVAPCDYESGSCFASCNGTCARTCSCEATCNGYESCAGTCFEYTCERTCRGSCGYCGPGTADTCLLPCG